LAAGLKAIDPTSAGAYVFLGDMPRVPAELTSNMAKALEGQARAVAPEFDGQRGHPVLLSAALFPKLLTLTGDQGAGTVLKDLGDSLILVPAPDDGCLFDIDRPGDLNAAKLKP
jgi:molybdenum cofactor cytidylyltransferase